jgi:CRP/FNR family cyclic AMP-dependent transcriptional regulator
MARRYSTFDILQWLPEDAGRAFASATRRRSVPARGKIYQQSDDGQEMFRLVSGAVRLSVMDDDGRDLFYLLFGPGDCFGASSLVDGEPRPQTAEAFDAVELQVLDRAAFERLRREVPELNDALLKLLARDMRFLSDYFVSAIFDEVSFRLAQRLVDVADTFGVAGEEGVALSVRLSQSELAAMVGTARQTVNRVLQDFQDKGWVSVRGGAITLRNLTELRTASQKAARLRSFMA